MGAHPIGTSRGPIVASGVLEVAHDLLFLSVYRDHGFSLGRTRLRLGVDKLELGVAIWMTCALTGLAIGLPTEIELFQQNGDRAGRDGVSFFLKPSGQFRM